MNTLIKITWISSFHQHFGKVVRRNPNHYSSRRISMFRSKRAMVDGDIENSATCYLFFGNFTQDSVPYAVEN